MMLPAFFSHIYPQRNTEEGEEEIRGCEGKNSFTHTCKFRAIECKSSKGSCINFSYLFFEFKVIAPTLEISTYED